jgi:serine phosphatase RsbU (regulator of sigma subunit)
VLNEALLVQRGGAEFCTVCLARLRDGRTLDLALAGHPPALVLRSDGSVERHGVSGTLLGVFPDPDLNQTSVTLSEGDTVLLYTDGVTDTGPGGAELGEAALEALLRRLAGQSPEEIVAEVERVAVETQADQPRDDIALVAMRILR